MYYFFAFLFSDPNRTCLTWLTYRSGLAQLTCTIKPTKPTQVRPQEAQFFSTHNLTWEFWVQVNTTLSINRVGFELSLYPMSYEVSSCTNSNQPIASHSSHKWYVWIFFHRIILWTLCQSYNQIYFLRSSTLFKSERALNTWCGKQTHVFCQWTNAK